MAVVRAIPDALIGMLAFFGTALFPVLARKELRQLRLNIREVWGLPPGSTFANLFERQCVRHQMIAALESAKVMTDPAKASIDGLSELQANMQEALSSGRGLILVTAHLGAWELCAMAAARSVTPTLNVLAKPARYQTVSTLLQRLRERAGAKVLWTDRKSLMRDMLRILKAGQVLGFVMDQKPIGRKGPEVSFWGRKTPFVAGPAAMAIRTGCPVVALFCVRTGPWRYRMISKMLLPANHGVSDEVALTQVFASEIERVIKLYPEQWTWTYKRWA